MMKTLESRNMTVGEAKVKVYKAIESLGCEFDLDELNELKGFNYDLDQCGFPVKEEIIL